MSLIWRAHTAASTLHATRYLPRGARVDYMVVPNGVFFQATSHERASRSDPNGQYWDRPEVTTLGEAYDTEAAAMAACELDANK